MFSSVNAILVEKINTKIFNNIICVVLKNIFNNSFKFYLSFVIYNTSLYYFLF